MALPGLALTGLLSFSNAEVSEVSEVGALATAPPAAAADTPFAAEGVIGRAEQPIVSRATRLSRLNLAMKT